MTATQIIHEIDSLPPVEKSKVVRFAKQLDEARTLSPDELGALAEQLAAATDPAEIGRLRTALTNGFYGRA